VILHQYGVESYYDVAAVREELADHPVAGELSAIENDRFYPSGNPVQGPIMTLPDRDDRQTAVPRAVR